MPRKLGRFIHLIELNHKIINKFDIQSTDYEDNLSRFVNDFKVKEHDKCVREKKMNFKRVLRREQKGKGASLRYKSLTERPMSEIVNERVNQKINQLSSRFRHLSNFFRQKSPKFS